MLSHYTTVSTFAAADPASLAARLRITISNPQMFFAINLSTPAPRKRAIVSTFATFARRT